MYRFVAVLVSVVVVALVATDVALGQTKSLKVGQQVAGELGGLKKQFAFRPPDSMLGRFGDCYYAAIPITLKAGQEISLTATVTGKTRLIGIQCFDPKGKPTDKEMWTPLQDKTITVTIDEANAKGKYTIVVFSDKIGPFTLTATSESAEKFPEPVEKKIDRGLRPEKTEDTGQPGVKGNLFVVAVGVSKYKDSKYNLEVANRDAEKVAEVLKQQSRRLFDRIVTSVLTDEKAARKEIFQELDRLRAKVNQHDLVIVTLSGHGANLDENSDFYFLPHDYDNSTDTVVYWEDFARPLKKVPCPVIFILDTCHSGTVTKQLRSGDEKKAVLRKLKQSGMVVMAACMSGGRAKEDKEWGHGALTLALLEGLSGKHLYKGKVETPLPKGSGPSQIITLQDLDYYMTKRVQELAGDNQAMVTNQTGNIPLSRVFIGSLAGEAPKAPRNAKK